MIKRTENFVNRLLQNLSETPSAAKAEKSCGEPARRNGAYNFHVAPKTYADSPAC